MEPTRYWSLLTSSIAVTDLERPFAAWAFLVIQGLVRDTPGDREAFAECVRAEIERGPITGPTLALRISGRLTQAGIALSAGDVLDPRGTVAVERMALIARWSGNIIAKEDIEALEQSRDRVRGSQPTSGSQGADAPNNPLDDRGTKKPWWKFW